MTIILFIVILAVLVLVHEFGHFAAAKQSGIRVDEFGLGFPPKIVGVKKGETEYTLNWIPFGGFVKIFGETPTEESLTGPDSNRSLVKKSKWKQIVVISAGVTLNFFFAWLLFAISFMSGFPASVSTEMGAIENPETTITSVIDSAPAGVAGLLPGDVIQSIQTNSGSFVDPNIDTIADIVNTTAGEEFFVTIERGGVEERFTVSAEQGLLGDRYTIGITMDEIGILTLGPIEAFVEAGKLSFTMAGEIAVGLVVFVKDLVIGAADYGQVSGPVGIAGLVGDASHFGFAYVLSFTAYISLHLAVLNLLPFPALDGGRLLFILIEMIARKPIKPTVANTINAIGFVLLLGLMLLVTVQDIVKLF